MRAEPDFRFGGRLSLDLTWTLRYRTVQPTELLVEPVDLRRWLAAVGLPAPAHPTAGDLEAARALREAIHAAASAVVDGGAIATNDRRLINGAAARPTPVPMLDADGYARDRVPTGGKVQAALSVVARDAVDLLALAGDGRMRRCAGPRCSLLFRDDSRPGTRRWCSTERCGNRVHTRTYRSRRRDDGNPAST